MADLPIGNVPTSILNDTDNMIFAEGQYAKKIPYSDMKNDIIGEEALKTTAPKAKEAINELVQDLLESTGYGIISGGVVSAQSTPNMTVQVTGCTLKTATGARQVAAANPTLAVTTADTTNPRKDIVYIDSTGVIQYLQGTAAASPTAPTTPTGGLLLYEIYIAANATTITSANITDKRKLLISTDWLNSQLSERVKKSTVNITYYVNTSTGLDTNDGVTSGTAFKTIQHAIDILPQVINHTITINIADGTYNEDLNILGFMGKGKVNLTGNTTTYSNVSIKSIYISECTCLIQLSGMALTTTTKDALIVANLSVVNATKLTITNACAFNGITATFNSILNLSFATISKKVSAINAGTGAKIITDTNNGTGNTYGLAASYGAVISKANSVPTGTTAEVTSYGGVIR